MPNATAKLITALLAVLVVAALLAPAMGADYVKKATWHESMIATRNAMVGKRPPSKEPTGLPDMSRDSYTIAAWIKTRSHSGTIFAKCQPNNRWQRNGKTIFLGGGRVCMDVHSTGVFRGTSNVADGKWHHVALVGTKKGQIIYVDGKAEARGNLGSDYDPKGAVGKIGYTSPDFPGRDSYFTGLIDDVRIYRRALGEKELKGVATKPDALGANGLGAHWPFDSDTMDASGNHNHAISMKGAKLETGKIGRALSLNGQVKILIAAPGQKQNPNIPIWSFLRRTFTDEAARNEMTWEIQDGIWRNDWTPGDYADLAKRYVAASHRSPMHARQAAKLAKGAKDASGLAKVRLAYLRSRAYEGVMDKLKELDIGGLRAMLSNLKKTGANIDKSLARLDAIETKAAKMAETEITPDAMIAFKAEVQKVRYDALIKDNPLMDFEKLLFVKRFKYQSNHYYTDFINGCSKFGGNLCVLDLKSGDVI
ncbi:MAG: LamG domain-containing protein, partial [Phycisphaerae bacterium]|nr:LamG domain-containing protein [Phycisphaerae bacterium]